MPPESLGEGAPSIARLLPSYCSRLQPRLLMFRADYRLRLHGAKLSVQRRLPTPLLALLIPLA